MRPAGPACAAPPGHGGGRLPAGPGACIAAWRRHRRPPSPSGTGTDPAAAPRRPHPTRKWAVTGSHGCLREHRPRASASCRARPRRPGVSRPGLSLPAAPRPASSRDVVSQNVPSRSPRPPAPRCGRRGAGARRDGGAARGTLGVVVPLRQRKGVPWGGGDYKSRHAVRLWPAGGAVPRGREGLWRRARVGVASDRLGAEAAPRTADGARRLCVLLAARDECRNPVGEEPRPALGLCMVTGVYVYL